MVCVFNEAVLQTEIIYLKGIISQVCMKQPVDQHQRDVNKKKEAKSLLNVLHQKRQILCPLQETLWIVSTNGKLCC